jgi:antitoxin ChpS
MIRSKNYSLKELIAQCDPVAPIPEELREWDRAPAVGLEKDVNRLRDIRRQSSESGGTGMQERPVPEAIPQWEQMAQAGLEQVVMTDQVDIREAVLVFREKLADRFDIVQLILFGSRARGDYHTESDADVAVLLRGQPGDFVRTKLAMAGLAFDVLLEAGVLIEALPVWENEWANPAGYANPDLLWNIAREGILLWRA